MTPEEVEVLRQRVDHDVQTVVDACAPYWWKDGDFKEAKETLDCIHPLEQLYVRQWAMGVPIVACKQCDHDLDREVVERRLK